MPHKPNPASLAAGWAGDTLNSFDSIEVPQIPRADATVQAALSITALSQSADARLKRIAETLDVLREWFPAAFVALDAPRRPPLKIGVHHDIAARAPAITPPELREALQFYCRGFAYLRAVTENAPRVDLDGSPSGAVTAEEAVAAKLEIEAIKARRRAREQAAEP